MPFADPFNYSIRYGDWQDDQKVLRLEVWPAAHGDSGRQAGEPLGSMYDEIVLWLGKALTLVTYRVW